MIDPVGWFELMGLIKGANYIFTDSGGMQKEAFWHKKLCYTLRNETEWVETVEQGANFIIKEQDKIVYPMISIQILTILMAMEMHQKKLQIF